MKCRDCKWHKPYEAKYYDGEPMHPNGGLCTHVKIHEDFYDKRDSDEMVYSYNEDGYFWTGDDFGCVHFERATEEVGGGDG